MRMSATRIDRDRPPSQLIKTGHVSASVHERSKSRALAIRGAALELRPTSTIGPHQPQPRAPNPFDVGQDLWQQLKRVTIPIFTGDKRAYSTWRAAFMACIDKAQPPPRTSCCNFASTYAEMHCKQSKASATREPRMMQLRRGSTASTAESGDESPRTWRPYNSLKQCTWVKAADLDRFC